MANIPVKFTLISQPDIFKFYDYPLGIIDIFAIKDSIFEQYPVITFHVLDNDCTFSEQYFYSQCLDFKLTLSDTFNKNSNLDHNYYLSNQSIPEVTNSQYVMGLVEYYLHSSYRKQDIEKSKSYKGNIDSIIRSIISKYEGVSGPPKTYISSTSNFDTWYQSKARDMVFIENLSRYALSPQNPNSPFYTFFNSKGEFYFQTVSDLFSQSPVDTYYYGSNSKNPLDDFNSNAINYNNIRNISIHFLSTTEMMDEYNIKVFKLNSSGEYNNKNVNIQQKISDNRLFNNKLTVIKKETEKVKSIVSYGLVDSDSQENHYKGWINQKFINTISFPYRLELTVLFDSRLCAGKLINLKFNSPILDKNNESFEYSGNWLILESKHLIDSKAQATTNLLVGKSSINVFRKHKLYNEFLGA